MRISDWSSDVCSSDLLDAGDRVVFSSKQIPGNEVAIGRIMNRLAARGIEMITERQAHIHVSGHPGRPELAAMYGWIKPELLLPVHGEMRHLMEQARYGLSLGIPRALVQTDGDKIGRATSELQSLMRNSYAVFCFTKKK